MSGESDVTVAEWEYYQCQIDDAAAVVLVDLSYSVQLPIDDAGFLYVIKLDMVDPGESGTGTEQEADTFASFEEALAGTAIKWGLHYVGRVQNNSNWQLAFYGPQGCGQNLEAAAKAFDSARSVTLGSKSDPEWAYYQNNLYPDDETLQWIGNRRVVDSLVEHGDLLEVPRRVDHYAFFADEDSRNSFVSLVVPEGFSLATHLDPTDGPLPYGVQIYRTDSVNLDAIHQVVLFLFSTADLDDGLYQGWETTVVLPEDA